MVATETMHVPRGASASNEYVYFIVMFIETKKSGQVHVNM